jgi:uncharacterized protein YbjT (DUF2867 family)
MASAPTIHTVAVLGGTGTLGKFMVNAILAVKPAFEKIVVVSRKAPAAGVLPEGTESRIVTDYSDAAQLTEALKGIDDGLFCTVGPTPWINAFLVAPITEQ